METGLLLIIIITVIIASNHSLYFIFNILWLKIPHVHSSHIHIMRKREREREMIPPMDITTWRKQQVYKEESGIRLFSKFFTVLFACLLDSKLYCALHQIIKVYPIPNYVPSHSISLFIAFNFFTLTYLRINHEFYYFTTSSKSSFPKVGIHCINAS